MQDRRVLILDNPPYNDLGPLKEAFLEAANHQLEVDVVWTPSALFDILKSQSSVELIVMDDVLEGDRRQGFDVLGRLTKDFPDLPVVVVVEESNVSHGPELIRAGASDFLVRGSGLEHLVETQLKKIARLIALIDDHRQLKRDWHHLREADRVRYQMIGDSPQIRTIREQIRRVARIPRSVLITGERGTGKELVARAIHESAGLKGKPIIVVNCAAFSDSLLESELFGHEKGAFTGAERRYVGKFEEANGGTLFLDEIGNMTLAFQKKIMRVVEYGTFRRIGGHTEIKVHTRVIAATNADLAALMEQEKFLPDLYDRLAFEEIHLPPLRERNGDVELLAQHFLDRFMKEVPAFRGKKLSPRALAVLKSYRFPGNIRELKNIIERAVYRDTTNHILPEDIGMLSSVQALPEGGSFKERIEAYELQLVQQALDSAGGNQAKAARDLGLSYHQFRYYLKKYQGRIG